MKSTNIIVEREIKLIAEYVTQPELQEAINYALFPGKRLRGSLLITCLKCHDFAPNAEAIAAAAAIEATHAFSLIHDDMPALDNAKQRRGKPSFFQQYGEANALLAGDLLQYLAQHHLRKAPRLLNLLVEYSGHKGMVFGQWLECNTSPKNLAELQNIQNLKTAKLFELIGAISENIIGLEQKYELKACCFAIGQCLQWLDDKQDLAEDAPGQNVLHFITENELDQMLAETMQNIISIAQTWPKPDYLINWLSDFR